MTKLANKIGNRLRYFRHKANLSQLKLAQLLATEASTIAHYERGQNLVSLTRLEKIAEVLDVDLAMFFVDNEPNADKLTQINTLLETADDEKLELIYGLIKTVLKA